jgi:hypothetical protein
MFSFSDIDSKKQTKNGITYHFPELNSAKLSSTGKIEYSMFGKENEPNVTYTTQKTNRPYVSNKLSIFSKTHDKYTEVNGELVIENIPITGTGKKLFLCFPIITDVKIQPNIIDTLIKNTEDETIHEIKLDDILPSESECILYETAQGIFVTFQTPITIQTSIQLSYRNIPEDGISSQKEQIHATKKSSWATSLFSSFMENPVKSTKEGFVEGLEDMDQNGDFQWMECQTADLDYSDNVPNVIASTSSNITNAEQGLLIATIVLYMVVIVGIIGLIIFYFIVKKTAQVTQSGGGAGADSILESITKSITEGVGFTMHDGPFSFIVIILCLFLFSWVITICSYFTTKSIFNKELQDYLGKTQLYGFTVASMIAVGLIIICSSHIFLRITVKKP